MKTEIRISTEIAEPYAVIYTSEVTAEIRAIASSIESCTDSGIIAVTDNERIVALRPAEIYRVRVEGERTVVYTINKAYGSAKRLYEFETILGSGFMRISKSVLINLQHIDSVEASIGGVMLLILKNGYRDYISRKYLPAFKKYLGI